MRVSQLLFIGMLVVGVAATSPAPAGAQTATSITTASQFFDKVAAEYAKVDDYQAGISITVNKEAPMSGTVLFKNPSFLRIDFANPKNQVIAFDGKVLTVYLPSYNATLEQTAPSSGGAGSAALASRQGLSLMKSNYTIAYESTPEAQPLEGSSGELAIRLVLSRLAASEGFNSIKLFVNPATLLIRRMEGITRGGDRFSFDFTEIKVNTNIPATRFAYQSPASSNVYNNFLSRPNQ